MHYWLIMAALFGSLLILLLLGLPIAFALGIVSVIAAAILWWPNPLQGLYAIALSGYHEMTNYLLVCVPLFILMAEVIFRSGTGNDTYEVIHRFLGKLPGGLGIASVVFGMVFGACCGASTAGTATVGLLSLPEMERRNYNSGLAGSLVGFAGALSVLIPPSILFIVYGVLTGVSVGGLFMGGAFPGVLATALASLYLAIRVLRRPSDAPRLVGITWKQTLKEGVVSLWRVWAMMLIIVFLLGSIYMGIATPTEASATSALMVFILVAAQRRLSWGVVKEALLHTIRITTMIGWIIVGAMAFGLVLVKSGAAGYLASWFASLPVPTVVIIIGLMLMYLILGMFIDPVGIILMTIPVLLPALKALHIDLLWFGVLVVINMCAGNISPPMGLNLYIVKGLAPHISMGSLFKEAWPLIAIDGVVILIIMFFPSIATWLPSTMG